MASKKQAKGILKVKVRGSGSYTVIRKGFRKKRSASKSFKVKPGVYRVKARGAKVVPGKVRVRKGKTVRVRVTFPTPPRTSPAPVPPDMTAPGPVSDLVAAPNGGTAVALDWTNPGDPDLADVVVRRAVGGLAPGSVSDGVPVALESARASSTTDDGLLETTTYAYAVFTRDTAGNPSTGVTVSATTLDLTPPGQVTDVTAFSIFDSQASIAWSNPADADLDEIIVRRAVGTAVPGSAIPPATPTDGVGVTVSSTTATSVQISALDSDSSHAVSIFTRDSSGNVNTAPVSVVFQTGPSPVVYPVFNYPQVGVPDSAISTELVRLLAEVPSGAQVVASFYVMMPNHQVTDALIAARQRGANVRVVLDSGNGQSASINQAMDETFERLGAELGKDVSSPSFAMQCVLACISKADGSINHNKFVAMSTAGDLTDVVFQTTSNMRSDGSGGAAFNAAVVSSGNARLYASYQGYFDDLAARRSVPNNDYHAVRPPEAYSMSTPYYFPRTDGVDSVSRALMSVDCAVPSTTVTVMASFFNRVKVRNRLNELASAGCGVRVIARTDTITREFCDSLLAPVQVRIADKSSASKVGIHGKYLTISGGFEGMVDRHVVWTGSHNLTSNSLVRNDETFLLIDDQQLHDAFLVNFDTIWDYPTVTPGCERALGTGKTEIEEEANTEVTPLIKAD